MMKNKFKSAYSNIKATSSFKEKTLQKMMDETRKKDKPVIHRFYLAKRPMALILLLTAMVLLTIMTPYLLDLFKINGQSYSTPTHTLTEPTVSIQPNVTPTPKSTEKTPDNKELNLSGVNINELPTDIVDVYNMPKDQFLLLNQLPDDRLYLYGVNNNNFQGVVLRKEDTLYYYNWSYLSPRFILPDMWYDDFDADGQKELAISLYINQAPEKNNEELHMFEFEGSNTPSDLLLKPEAFADEINSQITYKQNNDNKIVTISYENKSIEYNNWFIENYVLTSAGNYNNSTDFFYDNGKLLCSIGLDACFNDSDYTVNCGYINGEIRYRNNSFEFVNGIISDKKPFDITKIDINDIPKSLSEDMIGCLDSYQPINLLQVIPDKQVFIYGMYDIDKDDEQGIIISINTNLYYYNWSYSTSHGNMPEVSYTDLDNDSNEELALTFMVDWGTGVYVEELHILDFNNGQPTEKLFDPDTLIDTINHELTYKINRKTKILTFAYDDSNIKIPMELNESEYNVGIFNDYVDYYLNNDKIYVIFGISLNEQVYAPCDIIAEVHYQNLSFTIDNIILKSNDATG